MNCRTFLFLILCSIPFISYAQTRLENPETYLGVTAGETGSIINFNPSVKQTYLLGLNSGFIFRYISDKNLGVQAELLYIQRGWNESENKFSRRLDYIDLPFLSHFYLGNKFRIFFNIGPRVGFLISEKIIQNESELIDQYQHTKPIDNKFDYGFSAGVGFMILIKKQVFQIETRGNYSMSDIYSNNKKDYFDNSNNINLNINFSWLIKLN